MSEPLAALLTTLGFLLVGLSLVLLCARYFKIDSGALLLGGLFAPSLIFLAMSGRLLEFKGFGVEAKFREVAAQAVTPSAGPKTIRPIASSASGIRTASTARSVFGIGTEVVLLTAAREDKPVTHAAVLEVALQIYPGLLQGNFEVLAVLDPSDRVLGYFPRSAFLDLLRIELEQTIRGDRKQFETKRVHDQLEQTQLWDIVAFPGTRTERSGIKTTVRLSDSNAQVLSVMATSRLPVVVVVDGAGKYGGIVRRDDIVSTLVTSLAGQPVKEPASGP